MPKKAIEEWPASYPNLEPDSTHIIWRNDNSWKFGGRIVPIARSSNRE